MSQSREFPDDGPMVEMRLPEFRLAEYWGVLVKHRRLIALCIGVAVLIAVLSAVFSKPSYIASVVIAAEKDVANPLDPDWKPQVYGRYDPEFLPTQTRIMRSREIAMRVVQRLRLVDDPELNPKKSGLFAGKGLERSAEMEISRLAQQIRGSIAVEAVRGTNLVELSFVGPSPKVTADIANALAEAYITWNLEAKFEIVGEASGFVTKQIDELRQAIAAKEQQLLAYGRQKDIISADPGSNVTLQKLESFNADYAGAVADRIAKEARYHEIRNARAESLAESGLVGQLRAEQDRLERDYADKLNLFKPEWPAMQQLKAQIDKGRQNLDAEVQEVAAKARETARADYTTALRREQSLQGVLRSQKTEAQTMNTDAVEYNNLRTEVDSRKLLLEGLLKRQAETDAILRMTRDRASNIRIVDRAVPPTAPFKPSYKKNAVLGLLAGTALGVALAFLLSFLDRTIRTTEQVEQYLGLPALGVIPAVGSPGKGYGVHGPQLQPKAGTDEQAIELLPHQQPRSRVAERYRAFRTALLLSRAGGVKSIVVTSSFSREGKTATAVNLAVVLAQLGKRVLLVDADLHKPRLHEILRVSNRSGLVSILAEDLEPARAIVRTDLPDVYVVPSGPSSPNPSGLLASDAMSRFLELAKMNFDYVVLDAPPVLAVADALLLGHHADGVVICVKGGGTPREHVARVRDKLVQSQIRILGVLINNLAEDATEYGRRYVYDAGYYGEDAEHETGKRAAAAQKA